MLTHSLNNLHMNRFAQQVVWQRLKAKLFLRGDTKKAATTDSRFDEEFKQGRRRKKKSSSFSSVHFTEADVVFIVRFFTSGVC